MSEQSESPSPLGLVVSMTLLGAAGLLVGSLLGIVTFSLLAPVLSISVDAPSGQLVFSIGTYLGVAAVGALYLLQHRLPFSYIRLRSPSGRDILWAVSTAITLLALGATIPFLVGGLGLPFADHSIADSIAVNPVIALVSIPISLFVVGPAEEFLYRGVIQTRLTDAFETNRAVAIASLLFALTHILAYLDPGNIAGTLVTLFFVLLPLGAILGAIYELTGNLFVPALAHGLYNAITFALTYVEVVGL